VREELIAGGYPEETPVAVVYRASWPDEEVIRGSLGDIVERVRESGIKKTALIIVGEALRASEGGTGRRSRLYEGSFSHEYRK